MNAMLLELLAYCVWMVALDRLNKWIRYKIFRKKQTNTKIFDEFKVLLISYVKYILPLIVIAAFTETYVADWISHILS